jgi:1-deoxy-D-xylulose-5-phosphate synthase
MRFIKPLDTALVLNLAQTHELLLTIEDNSIMGGAGSAVSECLTNVGATVPVIHMGLPDQFLSHGSREELLADAGLTADGIIRKVETILRQQTHPKHATQV